MEKLNQQKQNVAVIGGLVLALVVFMAATNPERVSLGLLVVPIILIAAIVYLITRLFLGFSAFLRKKPRKRSAISFVVAFMVASLLVFQSIGQLTVGDVAIVAVLGILSIFYITRLF